MIASATTGPGPAIAAVRARLALVGVLFGLAALLRVLDGLTPLTAVFVAAPFVVAEVVLSTRRA